MTRQGLGAARVTALGVLEKVLDQGAYANLALQQALTAANLSPADRSLVTELVYGTLKQRLALDWHIQSFLSKPLSALPETVQHILRMGLYQLLYLDRIPARAAINEAVNLAKARGFLGLGGLVNAVLRNLERKRGELSLPDPAKEPALYLSVNYSHPLWMTERWYKRWGFEAAAALCAENNKPAPIWARTNTLKVTREELARQLEGEGVEVRLGERAPEALHISNFFAVEKLAAFQAGLFTVQDESSMLVAHVLGPVPGEKVVDACAAPGGKTTHMAQLMRNQGEIHAYELHPHKLQLIEGACRRLGVHCVKVNQGDARDLSNIFQGQADRVLVDAPCSGLGVLRRKPDARWKKEAESITELQGLQTEILAEAAKIVRPGGVLVYSTCTLEPEENFEVIKAFRREHPDFRPADLNGVLPFKLENEADRHMAAKGYIQFLPHVHHLDGFFIARLERTV